MTLVGAALAFAGGCGSEDPCADVSGVCLALEAGASAEAIQTALIEVPPGGTVAFGAGRFELAVDLSLDVDGVTVRGAGATATTLSFRGQLSGPQGMLVTADDFTIRDLGFEDSPGDALKILGARGVTIQRVQVRWTGGPSPDNGAYGLYPVQCRDVLIEESFVDGASDAGIYVGQSERIIVRGNRATRNVAGIEIENSFDADVYGNTLTANTGGVLVFNLPGLMVKNGRRARVFENTIFENNTVNFAPPGNIVAAIPAGTGIALLAAHDVEIFGNEIRDHEAINVGIISYVPIGTTTDATYEQLATGVYVHGNRLSGTSDGASGELGLAVVFALTELSPTAPAIVPDVVWDGVAAAGAPPRDRICIRDNGDADFLSLSWPLGDQTLPRRDLAPHDCSHPALAPVVLQ
jgi:parallel beta-helix repeat protein